MPSLNRISLMIVLLSAPVIAGMGLLSYHLRQSMLEEPLRSAAREVQKLLPAEVYDGISLLEARSKPKELVYVLQVAERHTAAEHTASEVIAQFREASIKAICTDRSFGLLLAHGATFRYVLLLAQQSTADGQIPAASFAVVEKSCQGHSL